MAGDAHEIAGLVPMPELLGALGFEVNTRTHRSACPLHKGSNPTAFSWTETGLWRCHSCSAGGDKISLVRAVRGCSFPDALKILCALAGVEIEPGAVLREEILRSKRERQALRNNALTLVRVERASWNEARNAVLCLEAIRHNAGRRLDEIGAGKPERFSGEAEWCWAAIAEVSRQMPRAAAAYAIASFAPLSERLRFALDANAAGQAVEAALGCGYVADDRGRRFEVVL
jgi:hypothetical protein